MVPELPDIAINGFYSQTQVAKLLGVSYDSVHRWINKPNGLPCQYNKRTGFPTIRGKDIIHFFNSRI
ncbi:MAG: helix-turn-helix domain-containing protein [Bacteroidales bacterium]|nr:helix-turn-helix domain-containing protein [Bacteroidales bacterium]